MNKFTFLFLSLLIVFTSCNRQVGAIFGKKGDKLTIVDPEFEYMSARAKFKFDHENKRVSATANFRIKKDSLIWISISTLGFEGARVLIDKNKVKIMDRLNKQYYDYSFSELSREYDFDFNFQMIQSVMLGNLIEPYKKQRVEKEDNYFTYTASKGVYLFHNYIGTNSMKLEKVRVIDEGSENTISVNYSNFIIVDNQIFPNEIVASIDYEAEKQPNTEISISYNRMEIEDNPLSFPYSVPSKYEKK